VFERACREYATINSKEQHMTHLHSATILALTFICGFTAAPERTGEQAREAGLASPKRDAQQSREGGRRRAVYVTAVDRHGAPVTDLTAADFNVKEGGKAREVVSAGLATAPMQIALLVDDNGTGVFRYGVGRFIERLLGRAEFSLSTVTGQSQKLVGYTASTEALSEAIAKLTARPATPDGGQLLEGISEAAKELEQRKALRPVIMALSVGGEEHSTLPAHHVLDQLRKSGAALYVVQLVSPMLRSRVEANTPAALLGENHNLGVVLGDGPKQSGGRRVEIAAATGIPLGLHELAESLKHQYLIEYALPEDVKPSDRISVSVKRGGVSLRAPTHIPGAP
jgi:VWFA-related protein